jgi:hypothetical protein
VEVKRFCISSDMCIGSCGKIEESCGNLGEEYLLPIIMEPGQSHTKANFGTLKPLPGTGSTYVLLL